MKISVKTSEASDSITYHPGPTMLEILQNSDFQVDSVCGGAGTCTKCRVQVTGFCPISAVDRKSFNGSELSEGWRLSCQCRPRVNLGVKIPKVENFRNKPRVIRISSAASPSPRPDCHLSAPLPRGEREKLGPSLVCDLGSTGVVVALGGCYSSRALEVHLLNKQVRYGGDVMTRLHNATKYGVETLQKAVLKTIQMCLDAIQHEDPDGYAQAIKHPIICAGNSAMTSLLLGWEIEQLAVSPYQPAELCMGEFPLSPRGRGSADGNPTGRGGQPTIQSMPLLGGFVGGDTAAAILHIESLEPDGPWMMVDIGTNTEIVIKDTSGTFWFASAPAGPAFEGGNITKGMRAEPGAISEAKYQDGSPPPWGRPEDGSPPSRGRPEDGSPPSRGRPEDGSWHIQTIGDDIPKGICGSGLIEIIDHAVQANLIHKDGFVPDGRLDVVDGIFLMADDIREFQLAKAATRTGIDILIQKALPVSSRMRIDPSPDGSADSTGPSDSDTIKSLYFAGTFASHLNQTSVKRLGLLPSDIPIKNIGNASLKGAFVYAQMDDAEKAEFETRLHLKSKQIELALEDDFQGQFVDNLNF